MKKKERVKALMALVLVVVALVTVYQPVSAYWVAGHEKDIVSMLDYGVPDTEVIMSIRQGDAQPYQVEYILDHGYLTAYIDELRAGGWISADYGAPAPVTQPVVPKETAPVTVAEPTAYTVTDMNKTMYVINQVNVRNGAATEYEKIGTLERNAEVKVTGQASTGWYRIDYNGTDGYVSDKYLTEEKPQTEVTTSDGVTTKVSENSVLPAIVGNDYDELNEDAEKALMYLTADEKLDNAYLNINADAVDKAILGEYLNYTEMNHEKGKISFVDADKNVVYTYDFGEYTMDAETELDLALDVSGTKLDFKADMVLPKNVTVTVKMQTADHDYNLYLDGELYKTVTSDADGIITFETDTLKSYEVKETLVEETQEVAVSENVAEPITEPLTKVDEKKTDYKIPLVQE